MVLLYPKMEAYVCVPPLVKQPYLKTSSIQPLRRSFHNRLKRWLFRKTMEADNEEFYQSGWSSALSYRPFQKTGISLDKLRTSLSDTDNKKPEAKTLKKILETLASDFAKPAHKKDWATKLWELSLKSLKQSCFRSGFQSLTKMSQNIPKLLVDCGD